MTPRRSPLGGWQLATPTRRNLLLVHVPLAAALLVKPPLSRSATAIPLDDFMVYKKFEGYEQQPDLYQGYGPAVGSPLSYTFEYPATWEEVAVTKTDKSTMGVDGRVRNPRRPNEHAFVVALGGKDYADARLVDWRTTLAVMAGGDPVLRQAISDGGVENVRAMQKRVDGRDVYMYDIIGSRTRYLAQVTRSHGTVLGLFVAAPPAAFQRDEVQMRRILDSFSVV